MRYYVKFGKAGSTSVWQIVDQNGFVFAHLHGPSAGIMALAAVKQMNNGFKFNGWTERLRENVPPES